MRWRFAPILAILGTMLLQVCSGIPCPPQDSAGGLDRGIAKHHEAQNDTCGSGATDCCCGPEADQTELSVEPIGTDADSCCTRGTMNPTRPGCGSCACAVQRAPATPTNERPKSIGFKPMPAIIARTERPAAMAARVPKAFATPARLSGERAKWRATLSVWVI